jgi:hypothetical protein
MSVSKLVKNPNLTEGKTARKILLLDDADLLCIEAIKSANGLYAALDSSVSFGAHPSLVGQQLLASINDIVAFVNYRGETPN